MNFLKENLFLVVTAAVVLVGGVLLLLAISSGSGQTEANAEPYMSEGKEISSLVSAGVNKKRVDAVVKRVEDMRIEAKEVIELSLLRNRRDYKVLSLDISGQTIPAFPVDKEFKDRETLRKLFPGQYRLRLEKLRKTLKPTTPPTAEELINEAARIAASIMPAENKDQPKPTAPRPGVRPGGMEGGGRPGGMEGGGRPGGMEGGGRPGGMGGERGGTTGRTIGTGVGQTAIEQQALINQVINKSENGWIYTDQAQAGSSDRRSFESGTSGEGGAMHEALPRDRTDYTDDSLWLAQVGLWVQRDIVDAIIKTNEQVQQTASGGQKGVAASAVKRLMSIDIRGYVLSATGSGEAAALQYLEIGGKKNSKPAPRLTGRSCNELYDVIHYDFTVVIPMQHLLRLQKNLMAQNYHTVLKIDIAKSAQSSVHFYGTDPVMRVSIVGEMLMLTDWTRGRWDKNAKQWDKNFPPLMPERVLEQIRTIDAGAIRDEDSKRLKPLVKDKTGGGGRGFGYSGRG